MPTVKKPVTKPTPKSTPVTVSAKPRSRPEPEPEQDEEEAPLEEEGYDSDLAEEESRPVGGRRFQTRSPQRPAFKPAPEPDTGKSELRFPEGSLFEGDRDSSVLFAGTFNPEELHELIESARADSTDFHKVRVKIFDVDAEYQKGDKHRVRFTFLGLQKPRQQQRSNGGGGYKKKW